MTVIRPAAPMAKPMYCMGMKDSECRVGERRLHLGALLLQHVLAHRPRVGQLTRTLRVGHVGVGASAHHLSDLVATPGEPQVVLLHRLDLVAPMPQKPGADARACAGEPRAAPYNLLHQQPASVTGERQPGDEVFDTLAARRPVLEAVLRELVAPEQRIELRHGCTVDALAMNADRSAVTGLRVGAREVAADLVIDAAGARGPVRGWLAEATGRPLVRPPAENRLTYVGRWFEATTPPPRLGPLLVNHASWSLLTLPSDGGAYAVVLVVGSRDRAAGDLHDPER